MTHLVNAARVPQIAGSQRILEYWAQAFLDPSAVFSAGYSFPLLRQILRSCVLRLETSHLLAGLYPSKIYDRGVAFLL